MNMAVCTCVYLLIFVKRHIGNINKKFSNVYYSPLIIIYSKEQSVNPGDTVTFHVYPIPQEEYNLENNETTYIQNKYINNQDYKNKTHLVKREINNKVIDYYNNDNNNLTPITVPYEKFIYNDNLENPENQNTKIYSNYNSNNSYINYNRVRNNLAKSTNVDSEKNIQFGKNNNEYNNIFFYNSNSNNNNNSNYKSEKFSFNEDKSNFHYRGNNIINNNVDIKEYNKNTVKYNKVYSNSNSNSNIISVSNVKENEK